MSGFGVEPEDMTRAAVLDQKLNALLAGERPAAGDELGAELSLMLEQLQEAFPPAVMPEQVEDVHFARMMEAAAELPADVTAQPFAAGRPGFLDKMRAGLSRRVAALSLALTTAFGGAAYAGILPTPIQSAAANAAAAVGLQLPRPGDDGEDKASAVADDYEPDERDLGEVTDGRPDDDHRRAGHAAGLAATDDDQAGAGAGVENDDDREDRDEGREDRDDERAGRDDEDDDERDDEADDDDADEYDDRDDRQERRDRDSEESDDDASDVEEDRGEDSVERDEPDDEPDAPAEVEDDVEGPSGRGTDSELETPESDD